MKKGNSVEVARTFLQKANWEQLGILKTANKINMVINNNPIVLTLILGLSSCNKRIQQAIADRLQKCFAETEDKPMERILQASSLVDEGEVYRVAWLMNDLPKESFDSNLSIALINTKTLAVKKVLEKMLLKHFEDDLSVDFLKTFEPTVAIALSLLQKIKRPRTVGDLDLFGSALNHNNADLCDLVLKWFCRLPKNEKNKRLLLENLQRKMSVKVDLCIAVLLGQYGDELGRYDIYRIIQLTSQYTQKLYFFEAWEEWLKNPSLTDYEILDLNQNCDQNLSLLRCPAWQGRLLSSFGVGVGLPVLFSWGYSGNDVIVRQVKQLVVDCMKMIPIASLIGMLKTVYNDDDNIVLEIHDRKKSGKISGQDFEELIKLVADDDHAIKYEASQIILIIPAKEIVETYGYDKLLELVDGPYRGNLVKKDELVRGIVRQIPVSIHKKNWSILMDFLLHKNPYTRSFVIGIMHNAFIGVFGAGRGGFRTCYKFFEEASLENKVVFGQILLRQYSDHLSNTRLKSMVTIKDLENTVDEVLFRRAKEGKIKVSFK